jgi:hypothetical protein
MTRLSLCLLLAPVANAHVMSMSTGDLTIAGATAHYELRIPLYEVAHVTKPEDVLLASVRFAGARLVSKSCKDDPPTDSYVCVADYRFAAPVDEVAVECTLAAVTVPNHVHLLHARLGSKREEAVFDAGQTRTTIRFHTPGAGEAAVTEAMAGLLRSLSGPLQWLFLAALVLAARSRRELVVMAAAFFAGECAAVALAQFAAWQPVPRFVEAAAALSIAYLAVETWLVPNAGARWLVAGVLGGLQGLWLLLLIQGARYHPPLVLAGAAVGQGAAIAALSWVGSRVATPRVVPAALGAFGLLWFFLTLRG